MKKRVILVLLFIILPVFIYAASVVSTYSETVTKANNYINSFRDRRKYLIFNKNYVYENGEFGNSESFLYGGLLSKSEFELSIFNEQSYLAIGKEYWTLTSNGSNNKYYIDAYLDSKSQTSKSGTRVTEYVKPGTIVTGKGTYSNPWTFMEGYSVDVISNNTSFGTVSPLGAQYVIPGSSLDYVLTPANGYFYNSNKDNCDLIKKGVNIYENDYVMENINRDITCTAVFELKTYLFNLLIKDSDKDYKGNVKVYTTNPNLNPIYFKYKNSWYSDADARNSIIKINSPTITGWTFTGYYYGDVKVIDENGNIIVTDLNLGSTNDFVDTNHVLYANITKNNYSISYTLDGGSFASGTKHPASANYDEIVEISNPTRAGYSFEGWTFNGNSSTAKTGNAQNNVNTTFTANSTQTKDQFFVNLIPDKNTGVTLTANWKKCSAGWYNDGTSINCSKCQPGYYSNETASQCTKCKTGSFSNQEASATCTICQANDDTGTNGTTTADGQTSCNASCNKAHVDIWEIASWDTNNNVYKVCKINSCVTGYTLNSTNNVCNANTYTIEYYQGNNSTTAGNTKLTSSTHTYDESKTLSAYSGTAPSGWTFYGWSTTQDGTTRTYSNNQSVINLASSSGAVVKLYAVFYRTINVYSGVSKAKNNSQTQYYNPYKTDRITSVTLATPETISNWTTLGYRTDTAANTSTQAAGTITPAYNGVNSYYAVYKRTLTISYNGNTNTGGSTSNTTATIYLNTNSTTTSSQEVTLRANGYTKTNNTFYKWAAGSTSGTKYSAGDKYNPSLSYNASTFGNTMYAIWLINTAIPTNSYCKSLTYNGGDQTLVNDAGTGFTWVSGTTGKAAGDSYTVTAQLSSGYIWTDGTLDNKTITCSIAKANLSAPTVSINSSGQITWGNVSNATSYQVKIDNGNWATSTSGATAIPTTTNGTYTAYVKAIGNSNFNNSSSGSDSATISDKIIVSYNKTKKKCNGTVYWDSSTNTVTENNCSAGGTDACSSGSNVGNSYTTCTFDHWYYTTKTCTYESNNIGCGSSCDPGYSSTSYNCNKSCTCNNGTYNSSTGKCTYNATAYYTGICDCWMSNDPDLHDVINCATRSSCSAACHGYTNSKGTCTFDHYQCGSSTSSSSTCSENPKSCSYPSGSYKKCYKGTWSTGSGTTTGTCSTSTPPANCTSSATYKTGCTKYVSKVAQTCKSKNVAFGAASTSTVTTKDETANNFSTCDNAHIGSTHISYTDNYGCGSGTNAIGNKCINK